MNKITLLFLLGAALFAQTYSVEPPDYKSLSAYMAAAGDANGLYAQFLDSLTPQQVDLKKRAEAAQRPLEALKAKICPAGEDVKLAGADTMCVPKADPKKESK